MYSRSLCRRLSNVAILAITATIFGIASLTANAADHAIKGIYAINSVNWQKVNGQFQWAIDSSMLTNSNVDGISVQQYWNTLEPADGTFVWTELDELVAQAAAAGKKITIGILPGYATPNWLYGEGAQSFKFIWDQTWGPSPCTVATIPVPWDSVFLNKWRKLISALGARYNGNATVAGVKLTGINSVSKEIILPHAVFEKIHIGNQSCTGYDDVTDWQKAGYTRTLIESTWLEIAQAYQQAFPSKYIAAVMQPAGLPPINDSGNIFTSYTYSGGDPQFAEDVLPMGIADLPGQFAIQNSGLTGSYVWQLEESYASQALTGYQTLTALGKGLPDAMDLGISAGARYLELYESDLLDQSLSSAISAARAALLAN